MPKNQPEYDRQYRLKNKEKFLAYERERYKRRTGKSNLEEMEDQIMGVDHGVEGGDQTVVLVRCMASFCKDIGSPVQVEGCTVYLCDKHSKAS